MPYNDQNIRDLLLPGLRKNMGDVCLDNNAPFMSCDLIVRDLNVSVSIEGGDTVQVLSADDINDGTFVQKYKPNVQEALTAHIQKSKGN